MFIRLKNGATWQVLGSDRYDGAVGSPPYGITFSEWALSNPAAWAYLAPIVIENGGWALFITTARGRNHAKSMLDMAQTREDWFSQVLPGGWWRRLRHKTPPEVRGNCHRSCGLPGGAEGIQTDGHRGFPHSNLGISLADCMVMRGANYDLPCAGSLRFHSL
jgi:hypothetical protein